MNDRGFAAEAKMNRITPAEARQYIERWTIVADAERRELQQTPVTTQFKQLCSLMASAQLFSDPERTATKEEVWSRWGTVRRAYGLERAPASARRGSFGSRCLDARGEGSIPGRRRRRGINLLVMKAIAHHPRDLEDIEALVATNPEADLASARGWISEFATAATMPELLRDFDAIVTRRAPNKPRR